MSQVDLKAQNVSLNLTFADEKLICMIILKTGTNTFQKLLIYTLLAYRWHGHPLYVSIPEANHRPSTVIM